MVRHNKKILVLAGLILVIGFYFYHRHQQAAPHMPGVPVHVMTIKQSNWPLHLEAIGTIQADNGIIIKSNIAGPVTNILFQSHSRVNKGEPLIEIFPDITKAELAKAESQKILYQLEYDRANALFKKKLGSAQSLDEARANLASNLADINQYRAQLSLAQIRAPFAGQLGLVLVSLGDQLRAGDPIVGLYDNDHLRIDFPVPQQIVAAIKVGQSVQFTTDSYPNRLFQATVTAYDSALNPDTRTLLVRAAVTDPHHELLPGMFVKVTLLIDNAQPTLAVPQSAISYSLYGNTLFKVVDNHAAQLSVKTGERQGSLIAVTSGLKIGDVVVTQGSDKLQNGAPVTVLPDLPTAEKAK